MWISIKQGKQTATEVMNLIKINIHINQTKLNQPMIASHATGA